MSQVSISAGVVVLVISTAALADTGRRLASRIWPDDLLAAAAAGLVVAPSLVVVILELLGSASLLTSTTMLVASVIVWIIGYASMRGARLKPSAEQVLPQLIRIIRSPSRVGVAAPAAALVLLLVAAFAFALYQPRPEFDALAGHLPVAVQWLQARSTWLMPYVSPVSFTTSYPANSELMALWLMLPVQRDFLAQLASLPGVALALAGTALTARELGARAPAALAAAILIPTMPRYLGQLVGTNMQDMLAMGAIAATAGFLALHRRSSGRGAMVIAGLAAGLAVGTRYAALLMIAPLVVLAAVDCLRHPQMRRRGLGKLALFAGSATVTGAYWYLRNLVLTGDPVYPQTLPWHPVRDLLGLLSLNRSYLALGWAPDYWRSALLDAWKLDGPVFFVLLSGVLLPLALAVKKRPSGLVAWGWTLLPAAALVAFLATPAGAGYLSPTGLGLQAQNLRYALLMLPVLAASLATAGSMLSPAWERLGIALLFGGALVSSIALNPTPPPARPLELATVTIALAAAVGMLIIKLRPNRLVLGGLATSLALAGALAGPSLATHYDDRRLAVGLPFESARLHLDSTASPVAVAGFCEIYPLYGPDLTRHVEYLTGSDAQLERPLASTMTDWVDSLRQHQVSELVIGSDVCFADVPVPQANWAAQNPDLFQPTFSLGTTIVYRFRQSPAAPLATGNGR